MPLAVRLATKGDVDSLLDLDSHARSGDHRRRAAIRRAVEQTSCLIAEQGPIVGYVITLPRHFFDRDFIELLMVGEDVRRNGVGRALLRAAVAAARSDTVFTSTNRSNRAMQHLLEAEGWAYSGELDGLDGDDPELFFYIATDA